MKIDINEIKEALVKRNTPFPESSHFEAKIRRNAAEWLQGLVEQTDWHLKFIIEKNDRMQKMSEVYGTAIDDIAELDSAHKMMAARNERLQKENDALAKALRKIANGTFTIADSVGATLTAYLQKFYLNLHQKQYVRLHL